MSIIAFGQLLGSNVRGQCDRTRTGVFNVEQRDMAVDRQCNLLFLFWKSILAVEIAILYFDKNNWTILIIKKIQTHSSEPFFLIFVMAMLSIK